MNKYFLVPIFWTKEIYVDDMNLYEECRSKYDELLTLNSDLIFYSVLKRPSKPESYVKYDKLRAKFKTELNNAFIPEYLAIKMENGNFYEMVTNKKISSFYDENITYAFASEEEVNEYINSNNYDKKIVNFFNNLGVHFGDKLSYIKKCYLVPVNSNNLSIGGILLNDILMDYFPSILKFEKYKVYFLNTGKCLRDGIKSKIRALYDKLDIPFYMAIYEDEMHNFYEMATGKKVEVNNGDFLELKYEKMIDYCKGDKYFNKMSNLLNKVNFDKEKGLKLVK